MAIHSPNLDTVSNPLEDTSVSMAVPPERIRFPLNRHFAFDAVAPAEMTAELPPLTVADSKTPPE